MTLLTPSRLQQLSSNPLLANSWHFISATVLGACNRPTAIPAVYEHALSQLPANQHLYATQQIREAILKSIALIGLPRVINSLTELKNVTPDEFKATELARQDKVDFRASGGAFWDAVYGKISNRVHRQLAQAYPDLDWYATNFVYGPLLSDTSILGPKDTSLTLVATLVPLDVNPQLKGHLKGAVNNGATVEEVNAARDLGLQIGEWAGLSWQGPISKL